MKFRYILPTAYVVALIAIFAGSMRGGGHGPNPFDLLVRPVSFPCELVAFVFPPSSGSSGLVQLVVCLLVGILTYGLLGFLIDVAIKKWRS